MRTMLILAAVVFQLLVLGWMAADRELVASTGRRVWLRTAPVDPRDPFRGDYVRLNYGFNRLPVELFRDGIRDWPKTVEWRARKSFNDRRVYVRLEEAPGGVMRAVAVSDRRPPEKDALWLRGRVASFDGNSLEVRYGLEAYFVEEGQGLKLENAAWRGGGDDIQTPLLVEAAVRASDGSALIRQVKPSPLGIGLTQVRGKKDRRLTGVTLKLRNSSDEPLAVAELPGLGAWTLAEAAPPSSWGRQQERDRWHWAGRPAGVPPPVTARDLRVLKPGEVVKYEVDLRDPAWDVVNGKGGRKSITELDNDWVNRFRFVYRAPESAALQGLPNAALVWQGELATRAFWNGGVD
ncbi:MAG: GDYXXLXY domain-containing protein [Lentisphaeria bacterium]